MSFASYILEDRCVLIRTMPDEGDTFLTTTTDAGFTLVDVNQITRFDISYVKFQATRDGQLRSYKCSFSAGGWMEGVERCYHIFTRDLSIPITRNANPNDQLLHYLQRIFFDNYKAR